jgi:hypothetical protein
MISALMALFWSIIMLIGAMGAFAFLQGTKGK